MPLSIKCVIVGDGTVGKTCLLMSYCQGLFPRKYVPTIFETYAATVKVGTESATLLLFDTAGQEDYDRIRILSYPGTDVFLLCFSLECESSFINVQERWAPELRSSCGPDVPIILVGTKVDIRDKAESRGTKKTDKIISEAEGRKMASQIRAQRYMECSALTQTGLKELFDEAIMSVLLPESDMRQKQCCLLS